MALAKHQLRVDQQDVQRQKRENSKRFAQERAQITSEKQQLALDRAQITRDRKELAEKEAALTVRREELSELRSKYDQEKREAELAVHERELKNLADSSKIETEKDRLEQRIAHFDEHMTACDNEIAAQYSSNEEMWVRRMEEISDRENQTMKQSQRMSLKVEKLQKVLKAKEQANRALKDKNKELVQKTFI